MHERFYQWVREGRSVMIRIEKLESINTFTSYLSKTDTVITYNYDTLVETSLTNQEKEWNHGLNDKDNGGIPILKMHGSVDWMLAGRLK